MTVTINGVDYSSALMSSPALKVKRALNAGSQSEVSLYCGTAFPVPKKSQRLIITADDGVVLFTGYISTDPYQEYLGATTTGPAYRTMVEALGDEFILDRQPVPVVSSAVNETLGSVLARLAVRVDPDRIDTASVAGGAHLGRFRADAGRTWSDNAKLITDAGRSSFRVQSGALTVAPIGSVSHALQLNALRAGSLIARPSRTIANDIALTGAMEPNAFALDIFQGDGVTTDFELTRSDFRVAHTSIVDEGFTDSAINPQVWTIQDPGSHFALSTTGLSVGGGTGIDGQTTLSLLDPIELGGSLIVEAGQISLAAGSDGVICGLYDGPPSIPACFAGFRVRPSEGALLLIPLLQGAEIGSSFTLALSGSYTARIRLHFPELVRSLASYYSVGEAGLVQNGGGLTDSPCAVEFEIQDEASAPNTPAAVLYDGSLSSTPAAATFCAVNSASVLGTIGSFVFSQPSTAWVTSVSSGEAERTRRQGSAAQGAECKLERTGKLHFYTAYTPAIGEMIKVRYRTSRRSVARLADVTSQNAEALGQPAGGIPGIAYWSGHIASPAARCSADCEAAVAALLDFSTSDFASWEGTVAGYNFQQEPSGDIWPGDVVDLSQLGPLSATVPGTFVVRSVEVINTNSQPEQLQYRLALANEWADSISVKASSPPAADAILPRLPSPGINAVAGNLLQLDIVSITSSSLAVTTGVTPPTGGGFEIRRIDSDFGNGTTSRIAGQNLVLRTSASSFSIPRGAEQEQFYVRMFDASTPALYSRNSAAIYTDVP